MSERKKSSNPYVGPNPFQKGDRLYGRDNEIRELLNLLIAQRIILLNSPSGAGKTSLIQAGLIPALEKEDFHVFPVARVYLEPPRETNGSQEPCNRYVFSVLVSLEANLPEDQKTPLDRLMRMSLAEYLNQDPKDPNTPDTQMLIFDQFEEILTVEPFDREGKAAFFAQLGSALRDRRRWGLFAMREDFVAALDPYARSIPTHLTNTFRLDLLGVQAARQAIQKPAQDAGVNFTEEAAQKLVDDLRLVRVQSLDLSVEGQKELEEQKGPYIEPVQLQVVCSRLWEQLAKDAQSITEKDIATVGDVDSALSEYYADRVKAISDETRVKERALRDWIDHRLITDRGLRNQVLLDPDSIGLELGAIRKLVDSHLVRQERRGGAVYLELAHDRLVRPVRDNNTTWKETHLSVLQRQASRWWREGQKPYLLLHGEALAEAEAWAGSNPDELAEEDRLFLEASQELRTKADQERTMAEQAIRLESAEKLAEAERMRAEEQAAAAAKLRRQAAQLKIALVAALLMLVVAAVSAWFAQDQRRAAVTERNTARAAEDRAVAALESEKAALERAEDAREEAERQRELAENSQLEAEQQKLIAEQEHKKATARQYAAQAINLKGSKPDLALLLSMEGNNLAEQIAADTGELIFDPKSSLLEVLTGSQLIYALQMKPGYLTSLAFSQDSSLLVSGDYSGNIVLWDLINGRQENQVSIVDPVLSLGVSTDKTFVAVGDYYGGVHLWNVQTGESELVLDQTFDLPSVVAFSPDGRLLATAGNGLHLGEAASRTLTLLVSENYQSQLAFSQDGEMLAAVNENGFVEVWETRNPNMVAAFSRQNPATPVLSISFTPAGENGEQPSLIVVEAGGNILSWDLTTFQENLFPFQASGFLFAYNPARSLLANDLLDGTIQLCQLQIRINPGCTGSRHFVGPSGLSNVLAISPDGNLLASAREDGSIVLWRVAGNALTGPPLQAHAGAVAGLAFHASGESLQLVSGAGGGENSLILWDVPSHQLEMPLAGVTQKRIDFHSASLAYSPDGRILASGGQDGDIRLLDTGTLTLQKEITAHLLPVQSLAFSPNGKLLAAGSQDYKVSIWDLANDRRVYLLDGHYASVSSVAFSPDGKVLASGGMDGQVILWDISNGQMITNIAGIDGAVHSLAFHPDGRLLAFGGESFQTIQSGGGSSLFLLDLRDSGNLPRDLQNPDNVVSHVAFSPDGRFLASANPEGQILLWDIAGNSQKSSPLGSGGIGPITGIKFSLDSRFLIVASERGLSLWDVSTRERFDGLPGAGGLTAGPVIEPNDGSTIAAGNDQGEILFWSLATADLLEGKFTSGLQVEMEQEVSALATSPDGSILASGGEEGSILLWDLASNQVSGLPILAHGKRVTGLSFSPDGDLFASGGMDGTVKIWDSSGQEINQFSMPGTRLSSLIFSPDEPLLVIVFIDFLENSFLYMWDLANPDSEPEFMDQPETEDWYWPILSMAFTTEGDRLALGRGNGMISLMDIQNRQWLPPLAAGVQMGQANAVTSLAFSGEGAWLASGMADGSLILWDAQNLQPVGQLSGHTDSIAALAFSPDSKTLASGGVDATVYLWEVDPARWTNLACRALNRNFSWTEWIEYIDMQEEDHYRETCPGTRVPDDVISHYLGQVNAGQTGSAEVEPNLMRVIEWSTNSQDTALLKNICIFGTENGYQELVQPTCDRAPDEVANHYLEQLRGSQTGSVEALSALRSVVESSMDSQDPYLLWDICSLGIENGQQEFVQPVCNRTADLMTDPLERASFYVNLGDAAQAEQAFKEAAQEAIEGEDADYLNYVCWQGSLQKYANAVLPACNLGVEIAGPELLPLVRDSRGLARAMTGDTEGAIEDFKFFIDWLSREGADSTIEEARVDILARRERFIEALENGQNPIDDEALFELANEIY